MDIEPTPDPDSPPRTGGGCACGGCTCGGDGEDGDGEVATSSDAARPDAARPGEDDGRAMELAGLVAVMQRIDRLHVAALRLASRVDGRTAAVQEGMGVQAALGLHAGWSGREVAGLLGAAELLASMPTARRLFEQGVLSWGHVRQVAAGAGRLDAARRALLDERLAEHAEDLARLDGDRRAWALQDLLEGLRSASQRQQRDEQQAVADRLVLSPRLDGSGTGFFDLHPEAFVTVAGRLQAEADAPRAAPCATEQDVSPPDEPATLDGRASRSRQLADALVRLCSRADHDGPSRPVRLSIGVDVDRLTDTTAGWLEPALRSRPPRIVRRVLERLACDATLEAVVRDGASLLAALRVQTEIPSATRRAVAGRDGGCRFPGCTAPISWCDVHHVLERTNGGDHHPDNLVLLCRRHHTLIHRHGWRQVLHADGRYTISRHGRTWTSLPRIPITPRGSPARGDPVQLRGQPRDGPGDSWSSPPEVVDRHPDGTPMPF